MFHHLLSITNMFQSFLSTPSGWHFKSTKNKLPKMCKWGYSTFQTLLHWVVPDVPHGRFLYSLYSCKSTRWRLQKWWKHLV